MRLRSPLLLALLSLGPGLGCGPMLTGSNGSGGAGGGTGGDGTGGGTGGNNGGGTGGGPTDGSVLGVSYPCTGGFVKTADGGVMPIPPDAGASPTVNCVVGQSYCSVESLDKAVGVKPEYRCSTLSSVVDGASVSVGLGVCSDTPTCACLCAQGVICATECACHDDGGFVTVSCHQV